MKIKAFTGIGTRRRQEDAYAIVEIPSTTYTTGSITSPSIDCDVKTESQEDTMSTNDANNQTLNFDPNNPSINSTDTDARDLNTTSKPYEVIPRTLIVVADGMGGHECGDVASKLVVNGLVNYWKGNPLQKDSPEKIRAAVNQASIAYEQKAHGREMGSTMVLATIEGNHAYIAHCGDSRIYVWRRDKHQFFHTNDHTRISEFGWELITNAFFTGRCSEIVPEIRYLELHSGDRLMLCSDGVFKFIPQEDLRRIFTSDRDLDETAESMEDYCKIMSRDNYTAVLVEF